MPVLPLVVLLPLIPFTAKMWISLPREMSHTGVGSFPARILVRTSMER